MRSFEALDRARRGVARLRGGAERRCRATIRGDRVAVIALLLAQAPGEQRGLSDRRRRRRLRGREHRVELGDRRHDPLSRRQHARVVQPRDAVVRIERDRFLEARQDRRRGVVVDRAPRSRPSRWARPFGSGVSFCSTRRAASPSPADRCARRRDHLAQQRSASRAGRGDRARGRERARCGWRCPRDGAAPSRAVA